MAKDVAVKVDRVEKEILRLYVVGTSPMICNRMSEKVKRELLLPAGRKDSTQKQTTLKHNPLEEFAASPYRLESDEEPTLLAVMASAFKGAMCTAALDVPGAKKAQIGRLVYVEGEMVPVYGVPMLFMSVTRSADMNKTPDVRTRAILPRWAAAIDVSFVSPIIKAETVVNLLSAAGITSGIGDWRPEKGKGDYGQFRLANEEDGELLEIMAEGDRSRQTEAMESPVCYDADSQEMLEWFHVEAKRRGFKAIGA